MGGRNAAHFFCKKINVIYCQGASFVIPYMTFNDNL